MKIVRPWKTSQGSHPARKATSKPVKKTVKTPAKKNAAKPAPKSAKPVAKPAAHAEVAAHVDDGAAYQVLARKYRPRTFEDLIGQEAMVRTLTNAFATGRIAHAFMLTGVRGVGKTTTARLLARALNNETDVIDRPSLALTDQGRHDASIMAGQHMDVVEMDAASHTGIDGIRDIIESVRYAPVEARYKVYVLDEVHMLSTQAFNALLKTLEEPPPHVKFIFATTEIRKVPVTVLSRCQRFDLRRVVMGLLAASIAGTVWPTAVTGAPWSGWTACTSRPATTSPWPGASNTVSSASRAAPRANTRWRAPCCRFAPPARTGWPTPPSPMRWSVFCSARVMASDSTSNTCPSAARSR